MRSPLPRPERSKNVIEPSECSTGQLAALAFHLPGSWGASPWHGLAPGLSPLGAGESLAARNWGITTREKKMLPQRQSCNFCIIAVIKINGKQILKVIK